ncbi:MAG: T9SS type A sorting domain-containing protein [Bacteroidota bacterium]
MKPARLLLFSVLSLFVFAALRGQTNPLQFFPIHTGNVWQYYVTLLNPEPPDSSYYLTARITGDSLLPNGRRYKVFDQFSFARYNRTFVRVDTSSLLVLAYSPFRACRDSEFVLFRLSPDSLRYTDCFGYSVRVDTGRHQIGLLRDTAHYQNYSWFDGFSNQFMLSERVGISYFFQWELAGWRGILVAARLNGVQYGTFVDVREQTPAAPTGFILEQNYPNPFNPSTTIRFSLSTRSSVKLQVFDLLGRRIATLIDGQRDAGNHSVVWDANKLSGGIYIYELTGDGFVARKKSLLLR